MGASRNVPGPFGRRRRLGAPKHGNGAAGVRIDVQFSGLGVSRQLDAGQPNFRVARYTSIRAHGAPAGPAPGYKHDPVRAVTDKRLHQLTPLRQDPGRRISRPFSHPTGIEAARARNKALVLPSPRHSSAPVSFRQLYSHQS